MSNLKRQYSKLRWYISIAKATGIDIVKDDFVIEQKRRIRTTLYRQQCLANVSPRIYSINDTSYIKAYDISNFSYKFTKAELQRYLWQNYARRLNPLYSPTGEWFTVNFKTGYRGMVNGQHTWLVHELVQIDV